MLEHLLAQGRRALAAVAQPRPAPSDRVAPGRGRSCGAGRIIHSITKDIPAQQILILRMIPAHRIKTCTEM
jgi:hypothetical protein